MISPNNQNVNQQGRLSNAFFIRGGRDSAMSYPVAAGYEAFLVDEENKMFFIKSNDPSGRGFVLREFTYEEITPKQNTAFGTSDGLDLSKYATKEDLNTIIEEIRKLQGERDRGRNNYRNNRRSRHGKSYEESI